MGSISRLALTLSLVSATSVVAAADITAGAKIFGGECAACHQADGAGATGLAPPLKDTLKGYLATAEGRGYLSQILISGMAGPIKSQGQAWNGVMPSFAQHSDSELASVLAYLLSQFNGVAEDADGAITAEQIADARKRAPTAGDTRKLRLQLQTGGN